jgi:hypothetical protein
MPNLQPPRSAPYRRASEIGSYLYCRRAWWLEQVRGEVSAHGELRESGHRAHAALGRRVHRAAQLRRLAVVLGVLALVLLALELAGWW